MSKCPLCNFNLIHRPDGVHGEIVECMRYPDCGYRERVTLPPQPPMLSNERILYAMMAQVLNGLLSGQNPEFHSHEELVNTAFSITMRAILKVERALKDAENHARPEKERPQG